MAQSFPLFLEPSVHLPLISMVWWVRIPYSGTFLLMVYWIGRICSPLRSVCMPYCVPNVGRPSKTLSLSCSQLGLVGVSRQLPMMRGLQPLVDSFSLPLQAYQG